MKRKVNQSPYRMAQWKKELQRIEAELSSQSIPLTREHYNVPFNSDHGLSLKNYYF